MRPSFFAALIALTFALGCSGQSSVKSVASGEYPALEELAMDTLMMVGPEASMGNWPAVKKVAASPKFEEKVKHFEQAEMPSSIPDGAALKEQTVKSLQNLITTARTNGNKDSLQAAWSEIQTSVNKLNSAAEGRRPS